MNGHPSNSTASGETGDAAGQRHLDALRRRLSGLMGWRRWVALAGLGVLAAMALPPVYFLVLLIPAFTGLLWIVEDSPGVARSFSGGWWFGFGHSAAGLSWIGSAFFVDAPQYGWMAPIAISAMAAGMGLFTGAASALSRLVFDKRPLSAVGRVIVFSALWTLLEWVRGWALTGFPWNLIGTVWVVSDSMIQLAAVTGVYGLSLLTIAAAAMPAVLADHGASSRRRRRWVPVLAIFAVIGVVWTGGQVRLASASSEIVAGVQLRLVQPNIPQALKWKPELRRSHVQKQLKMSLAMAPAGSPPAKPPTHIIWAEASVPYILTDTPGLTQVLGAAAPPGGLIIVGAPRATPRGVTPRRIWNSLHAIDGKGRVTATYDKHHLVPFGEYVPFRDILPIEKLTAGRQDFSPGPGIRTVVFDGLPPVSPLICYEVIFPGNVADPENRPQWILNLTNDGWFGQSFGPYQHFAAARLRAVEEGLPLVRVANTGISGVIDGYGRTVKKLGLGREGVIDSPLPVALDERTPFSRFGGWITVLLMFFALAGGILLAPSRNGV
ncbi:MAG: apolipoprotein N-acyltransferase [Proteobacteria bacterium]|nr:apolipoprotein N-acyltransferase [Pseudomonadota bacterium]